MCSPEIMARVHSELKDSPRTSRRGLMKSTLGVSAAALLAAQSTQARQSTPAATPVTGAQSVFVDLTHVMQPESPIWPGNEPFSAEPMKTFEADGFYQQKVTFWEHTGTHVDAPIHFDPEGIDSTQLDVGTLFASVAVIDISDRAAEDHDTAVTVDDILGYESEYGELPTGALVAMNSGWGARWDDAASFVNQDADGVQHYPGFSPDAAEFLVSERDIVGIAVDTLSQDPGNSTDFGTHLTILGAGKYGIEGLANVDQLAPFGASVFVGAPKWAGASGGPARIIGIN